MPRAWIHELSKQQLESLASQLGVSTEGTLDDLRKRVRDKWTTIEPYLPPQASAKSIETLNPIQPITDPTSHLGTPVNKMKIKVVTDLIAAIPPLIDMDPEQILKFLIQVNQIIELKLLPDTEFMALLITRTSGRLMHILGTHLGSTDTWGVVQAEIISTFLPPRIKEQFLVSYVLDRFQSPTEDLTEYIMSVVSAAKILGFLGTEVQLVHRIVQNLHPKIKSYCVFQNRPESIASLFSLATTVAEAVAVEDQRRLTTGSFPREGDPRPFVNATVQTKGSPAKTELKNACWACGKTGHFQSACPSKTRPTSRAGRSGNARGARQ
ncbi:hypothetical protein B7P43_G17834 [Cryptotermes secundus]|uniref:CCHC-type domain-containing protein n=1 Tax=Cryptotermes secundus TaxID=105785 RepID=A0A2J7Q060_9NEOP|nr:hypothetical protein B7P43_G17765 [Cryptotermes secundus]PNF21972.1 hypothetical protein B7P43_G17898 [Cryptotermes secundus]PNF21977.1 hypothetical protein B7P43_G17834 [Cryptotermes secundus]